MIRQNKLEMAEEFAKQKHGSQIRKGRWTLYSIHLEKVVNNLKEIGVKDEDILCAGWLHDVLEDTNTNFDDIHEKFGLQVAEIVSQVTKDKRLPAKDQEMSYAEQLQKVSWQAQAIKFCEVVADLSELSNSPEHEAKKDEDVSSKLRYIGAIVNGLIRNKDKIPNLKEMVNKLNGILLENREKPVVIEL